MRGPSLDLSDRIYSRISKSPATGVWTQADFADLAARDALDKTLQRLVKASKLRRIDRGLFDIPRLNPATRKPVAPDYRQVIEAIARRDRTRMLVDGMTAANDLGLSDAVPGQVVVHSDARLKSLHLGNLVIRFRPTAASKLYWAGRPAMRIVQALHWLKPKLDDPKLRARVGAKLSALLRAPGQGAAASQDLRAGLSTMPAWMQDFVRQLLGDVVADAAKPQAKRRKAAA
jgi:hypothetical protein